VVTFIRMQSGFMGPEDFRNYYAPSSQSSRPASVPCRATSGTDYPGQRRSEQLAMFRISAKSCRVFTFAETLIMAAMNVETARFAFGDRGQPKTATAQRREDHGTR
jgi:hypothetical protein